MPFTDTVMFEEQLGEINAILTRLRSDSSARGAFLIDRNGQQIASTGEDLDAIDSTALASLTAGNVASTDAIAKLIGEREFLALVHEGDKDSLHISMVNDRIILLVLFDERSSLGLVRLRVRKAAADLVEVFQSIDRRQSERPQGAGASPFAEITDDDIDSLFA
ncbi:MAG TPA: roadblock/LC7 domain-containing protein [Candidatus Polarisedimenticolia bacterium]|nr:roadblock/LC7 domain-containing protein [Candidatus Polarisedimenticolia bacterium]